MRQPQPPRLTPQHRKELNKYTSHPTNTYGMNRAYSRIRAAEHKTWAPLPTTPDFKTAAEVETYIHWILNLKWINKWFPHAATIKTSFTVPARGPWRSPRYFHRHNTHHFCIPKRHRYKYMAVHLLMHALVPPTTPHREREFARQLTRVYRIIFNTPTSKKLKQHMKQQGCKYSKHHYPNGVNPTIRAKYLKNLERHH